MQPLGTDEVELQLFNTFDNAARLLVRSLRLPPGPEIDPGALVIVGFGAMGQQAHAANAARRTCLHSV